MSAVSGKNYDYNTSTQQQRDAAQKEASSNSMLDRDAFLQLLICQLQNQDPLNPSEEIDFTSQLAQLQALEEQISLNSNIKSMLSESQTQTGSAMVGMKVTGLDGDGELTSGVAISLVQNSSGVFLQLDNGKQVAVKDVTALANATSTANQSLADSYGALGMWIEGSGADGKPLQGIVEKVVMEKNVVKLHLYGGESMVWDDVTAMRAPTDDEVWYYLPSDMRALVEKAQGMVGLMATGTTADGDSVTGLVSGAELSGSSVYLTLFDGRRVDVSTVKTDATVPTAEDLAANLTGLKVNGYGADGKYREGVIADATTEDGNLTLILEDGSTILYTQIGDIGEAA